MLEISTCTQLVVRYRATGGHECRCSCAEVQPVLTATNEQLINDGKQWEATVRKGNGREYNASTGS
jgi:hypothetical protein